jgi:hypothetical protein
MDINPKIVIALFHIFIIVPLLLFVGMRRINTPDEVYHALLIIGTVVLGYHLWRLSVKYRAAVSGQWVNLIHVALIAPLLIYIGANKKETPRYAYELLMLTGFGALGYHLITLIQAINID